MASPAAAAPPSGSKRGLAALALVVALLPLALPNNYTYEIAILVGLNAIVCVGLNLLVGYAGQISLGHAGFFGLGAYGSAILAARYGWPTPLSLVAAVSAVALLAWAIGRPILRLKGHALAMATLGLGIIVSVVIANEDRYTGGPDGMSVPPLGIAGLALSGERAWYWVVGALLVFGLIVAAIGNEQRVQDWDPQYTKVVVDRTEAYGGTFYENGLFNKGPLELIVHRTGSVLLGDDGHWIWIALISGLLSVAIAFAAAASARHTGAPPALGAVVGVFTFLHFTFSDADYSPPAPA